MTMNLRTLFFVYLSPILAFADVSAKLDSVKTSVSGNFRPFVLAVDDKKIIVGKSTLLGLKINGHLLEAQKTNKARFFARTDSDVIEIVGHEASGNEKKWTLPLPIVKVESVAEGNVSFHVSPEVAELKIDGERLVVSDARARWALPKGDFAKKRVVEARGAIGKPGRLYNLTLRDGSESGLSLLAFRVSQISVFRKGLGNSYSAMLSWNPEWRFLPNWRVGGSFGASVFKANATENFKVLSYELALTRTIGSYFVEGSGGVQNWYGFYGVTSVASVTVGKLFEPLFLKFIERVFVSGSHSFIEPTPAQSLRVGFGISL